MTQRAAFVFMVILLAAWGALLLLVVKAGEEKPEQDAVAITAEQQTPGEQGQPESLDDPESRAFALDTLNLLEDKRLYEIGIAMAEALAMDEGQEREQAIVDALGQDKLIVAVGTIEKVSLVGADSKSDVTIRMEPDYKLAFRDITQVTTSWALTPVSQDKRVVVLAQVRQTPKAGSQQPVVALPIGVYADKDRGYVAQDHYDAFMAQWTVVKQQMALEAAKSHALEADQKFRLVQYFRTNLPKRMEQIINCKSTPTNLCKPSEEMGELITLLNGELALDVNGLSTAREDLPETVRIINARMEDLYESEAESYAKVLETYKRLANTTP